MHPTLPRTVPAPATRTTRPAAAHRALPARRAPAPWNWATPSPAPS